MSDASGLAGLGAIRNLDYTVLLCDDLSVMRRFYADVMGFPEAPHDISDSWVEFRIGATTLALRPRGNAATNTGGGRDETTTAGVQLAFRVPPGDVIIAAAQLAERGVTIVKPVTDQSFGHRTVFFADPEHNVIEIYAEI